jgi:hypothetical protein
VDANPRRIETWSGSNWKTKCLKLEVNVPLPFNRREFDVVVGTDFLEHLSEYAAFWVIKEAEEIAKKYIIWFTPIGFMDTEKYQAGLVTCEYDKHLSGFTPEYFANLGYSLDVYEAFHFYEGKVWGAMWAWKSVA